jgi:hypothetical protein
MAKRQTTTINWWVDFILFTGFILAFLLDVTGLSLHQWGGLFICILATYHLLRHWKWIINLLQRFFQKRLGSPRLRFMIDLLLMVGFEIIFLSGLLISTWLELPLSDYLFVRNLHVFASISTLALLVLKVALHVRWIISSMRKIFQKPVFHSPHTCKAHLSQPNIVNQERRAALRLMGTVGVASLSALIIGGSTTFRSIFTEDNGVQESPAPDTLPTSTSPSSPTPTASPTPKTLTEPQAHTQRRNRGQNQVIPTSIPSASATQSHSAAADPTLTPTPTSTASACVVRCPKGCAYPGSCRRYVDANFNNLCDLGECL